MYVENKDGKGNPNHDELGRFSESSSDSTKETKDAEKVDYSIVSSTPAFSFMKPKKQAAQSSTDQEKPLDQMTTQEMDLEIKRLLPKLEKQMDLDFWDDKIMFGGDKKTQCAFCRQFAKLVDEYPVNFRFTIGMRRTSFGVIAQCRPTVANEAAFYQNEYGNMVRTFGRMEFSDHYLSRDYNRICQDTRNQELVHQNMPCADEYLAVYSATHEYGHMYSLSLINQAKELFNTHTIKKDLITMFQEKYPGESWEKEVSRYALSVDSKGNEMAGEFFAEVFANYNCGKRTKMGEVFGEWLKKRGFIKGDDNDN